LPFKSTETCWLVSQVVLRRKALTRKTQAPGEEQLPLLRPLLPGEQVPTRSIPCCLWSRHKAPQAGSAPSLSPPDTVGLWPGPLKAGADASSWQEEEGLFVLLWMATTKPRNCGTETPWGDAGASGQSSLWPM